MTQPNHANATAVLARKRGERAPEPLQASEASMAAAFEGALLAQTRQMITAAMANVTRCIHTARALGGNSDRPIEEAIRAPIGKRAGGTDAHCALARGVMRRPACRRERA